MRQAWKKKKLCGPDEIEPTESLFRKWAIGSFEDITSAKRGDMTVGRLKDIMDEFPDAFRMVKPLCLKIRSILFGDTAE